jgi:hypothetical protein
MAEADDVLAKLPVDRVAAWYRRLAHAQIRAAPELQPALAGSFLLKWLDNRKSTDRYTFRAPEHLKKSEAVIEVLRYHRDVFMTYRKGRIGKKDKWVGILPRLQGKPGFTRWNMSGMLTLQYESLCDFAPHIWDIARIQQYGSSAERDLFGSLRGFQLKSNATFTGKLSGTKALIRCFNWDCFAIDRYDWNYNEHLTMPNPDFNSSAGDAVAPRQQTIKVYHLNAKRLEAAKLAAPYDLVVGPWTVTDARIIGDAGIDTTKQI